MDDKELKELLSRIQVPNPPEKAKKKALNRALEAFDQKMQKRTQGITSETRLIEVNPSFKPLRSFMMQKKYLWSGLAGSAVAVAVLIAVLGTPYLQQTYLNKKNFKTPTSTSSTAIPTPETKEALSSWNTAPGSEEVQRQSAESTDEDVKDESVVGMRDREGNFRTEAEVWAPASPASKAGSGIVTFGTEKGREAISGNAPPGTGVAAGYYDPSSVDMPQPPAYHDQGRDKFQTFEENMVKIVKEEPVSTFSIDVDTASYSFMRGQLNNGVLPQKDAVRIEEMINYFDYNYALPEKGGHPFKPTVAVYDTPWHKGHKLIHIGIKAYDITEKPQSNLVFLIDTSGSMDEPNKLPLLKNSFKMMLDHLSPDDTVGIVVYAGSAGTVLEPTKVKDKRKILQALDNLRAGGSTAGAEGIRQAYNLAEKSFIKDGNNRIILATDGDFNVGITNPEELKGFVERKRGEGIFLSVLGFGEGNYNDQMMQTLAQNGNGNAAYIDNLNEARKVLVDEASSTLFTVAKDVKIQVEFNPAMVSEYRLIGYETRHLNREDFNNDKVDAGEVGAGHAVTALYEITPVGTDTSVDDLRYSPAETVMHGTPNGEYAFLKIRYKKPDSDKSILMTRPITAQADEVKFEDASDDIRFAAAVAGFGELLKGSKYVGDLTYDQVTKIANAAHGKDEFGYRTEFVNLVRLAKSADAIQEQKK